MEKVLVSACLLGKPVQYNGKGLAAASDILTRWQIEGRLVLVCPEVDAGMSIPRAPAEIVRGDGTDVWLGKSEVIEETGTDVSVYFKKRAQLALALCQKHHIKVAVLTESSPSCGSNTIYNGHFSNNKIAGMGVTAALLRKHGIEVFSQYDLVAADSALQSVMPTGD
ncbi:DUF523 domain-containing protein [Psychrobacter sp. T6-6]|uniref:DUF523 domain-containing protein n=1 Tax=Psychrobacter sp. T6-6 TaxID=3457452 RepID=UPI003FD07592